MITFAVMGRYLVIFLFLCIALKSLAGDDNKLFSIFPVPLKSSKLTVKRLINNPDFVKVELRNLIGKKLQEKEFSKGAEEVVLEEMDTYPNGIYVILAVDSYGKIIETAKFIINR